jgi:hypothetical protein
MPPPSQLSIATSSLQRLIKEEASYHREMEMQQKSIDRLERGEQDEEEEEEAESGNREYLLGQEVLFFFPVLSSHLSYPFSFISESVVLAWLFYYVGFVVVYDGSADLMGWCRDEH